MTLEDQARVLAWRNAPEVRSRMRNPEPIGEGEHATFVQRVLADPTKRYLVFEEEDGTPQGLVYFSHSTETARTAEWGLYLGEARGRGFGTAMAVAALDYAFAELALTTVDAEVLGLNLESLRFHAKLGFRTTRHETDAYVRGERRYDVHRLAIEAKTWASVRDAIAAGAPTDPDRRPLVIASTKHWNHRLVPRVAEATGRIVHWIDRREEMTGEYLKRLAPEYVFLPHWSFIITSDVLDSFETVVFHMTDLPFGRGGSPLQNLIARGHRETKITALRCTRELDAGDIYAKAPLSLFGGAEEIYMRARDTIESMIVDIIHRRPEPTRQVGEVTVFKRRTPEQSDISELDSLDQVFDWIRMLDADGYPRAFAHVGRFRIELSRPARYDDGVHADVRITLATDGGDLDA